jgi:HAD superfamily hydrolase (TIGR01484 family)
MSSPRPIATSCHDDWKPLRYIFTDIDDTLTTDGQLTASVYQTLETLSRSGLDVIPVTGRPAGWCDMIARFWPVRAVVGENGVFYFCYD